MRSVPPQIAARQQQQSGGGSSEMRVSVTMPGSPIPDTNLARLYVQGLGTLVLPWWPTEVERSGLAPGYVETPRPGRAPLLTRSSDPLPSLRIAFTISDTDPRVSIEAMLSMLERIAAAQPVAQLMLGPSNRGLWRIVEAGAVETDWADNGGPSSADVVMVLRRESDAEIIVGPIRKKPKR